MTKISGVSHNGKVHRHSYKVNFFDGSLKKYPIKNYYFKRLDKKHGTVELSNGLGSFISYLDPRHALKVAVDYQKKCVGSETLKLNIIERQLRTKRVNQKDKFCTSCLKSTRLLVHCGKFTQKR